MSIWRQGQKNTKSSWQWRHQWIALQLVQKNKHKHHIEAAKLFHRVKITLHPLCPQTFNNARVKKYCDTCCSSWRTKSKYLRSSGGDTCKFSKVQTCASDIGFRQRAGCFPSDVHSSEQEQQSRGCRSALTLISTCYIHPLSCASPQQFSRFIVIFPLWRQRPEIMMGFVSPTLRSHFFFHRSSCYSFFFFVFPCNRHLLRHPSSSHASWVTLTEVTPAVAEIWRS